MAKIDYKKVVQTAIGEIGYQGESKSSKYSKYLDNVHWYNYKKDGACTWCAIFYDYCVAVNKGDLSYEQARQVVCEPANHNNNSGAGCTQKAQMYKDAGRWISRSSDATTGDQIFFKKSNGQIYHTGIIIDWDNKGFYTVEGSTDGAKVTKRFYSFGDSKIAGFGRPNWYKFEDEKDEKPKEDAKLVEDKKEEEKPSASSGKKYRVIAVHGLNVRKGASKSSDKLYALNYGAVVSVYEIKNGWGRIGDGKWVCMDYLKAV